MAVRDEDHANSQSMGRPQQPLAVPQQCFPRCHRFPRAVGRVLARVPLSIWASARPRPGQAPVLHFALRRDSGVRGPGGSSGCRASPGATSGSARSTRSPLATATSTAVLGGLRALPRATRQPPRTFVVRPPRGPRVNFFLALPGHRRGGDAPADPRRAGAARQRGATGTRQEVADDPRRCRRGGRTWWPRSWHDRPDLGIRPWASSTTTPSRLAPLCTACRCSAPPRSLPKIARARRGQQALITMASAPGAAIRRITDTLPAGAGSPRRSSPGSTRSWAAGSISPESASGHRGPAGPRAGGARRDGRSPGGPRARWSWSPGPAAASAPSCAGRSAAFGPAGPAGGARREHPLPHPPRAGGRLPRLTIVPASPTSPTAADEAIFEAQRP